MNIDPIVALEYRDLCQAEQVIADGPNLPGPVVREAKVRRRLSLDRIVELTEMDLGWECPPTLPPSWADAGLHWYQDRLQEAVQGHAAGCDCPDCFLAGGPDV